MKTKIFYINVYEHENPLIALQLQGPVNLNGSMKRYRKVYGEGDIFSCIGETGGGGGEGMGVDPNL